MRFVYSKKAQKQFCKLDISIQKRIKNFTDELQSLENSRNRGKRSLEICQGFVGIALGIIALFVRFSMKNL